MTAYEVFPDIEAIVGYVIRSADIDGLDARVYSSIPREPTYPLAIVKRIGGTPAERHHLDAGRIQVEVWGGSKSEIHDITQLARVAIHEAEGTTFAVDGGAPVDAVVTGVEDDLGLQWIPDPTTGRDRYIFGVIVYAR